MNKLFPFFRKISPLTLIAICSAFTALVLGIDWFSGPYISTSIFYLLPISIAAWFVNRRTGVAFSIFSAFLWFVTDYFTGSDFTTFGVSFWNAVVRLCFFLIVVFSLAALRRSLQRQEDLMSFVIHDLRAPLGNMITAFDLLQMDAADASNSQAEVVKLGKSSGKRMMVLVDSLLDLSRLESGKVQLQRENVNLKVLIDESIAQVVLTAEFKMVAFEKRYDSGETAVFADRLLTQRIVVNLLNNAIKFSPQGGIITLQTAPTPEGSITISVRDQGPGISAEWQNRVFAKYGQVSGGKSGGSGLGLTFCKLAVEAQNGRIWLESETGSGTTLRFTLPKA
jgi:signal transduction histidine kinase